MIKDFLISFKDSLNEKSKNPFLGTYLLVWLIRNWELIYTLFNFDEDLKLENKVNFIQNYYTEYTFLEGLLYNILWTFLFLIITFILLNVSRFIVNISEKRITPWIYKVTDSKSTVLKSDHLKLIRDKNSLQDSLEIERNIRFKLENKIKELEDKLSNTVSNDSALKKKSKLIIDILKDNDEIQNFYYYSGQLNDGKYLEENHGQSLYIELGLMRFDSMSKKNTSKKYTITELGEYVLDEIRFSSKNYIKF